jgi:malonyl-CoA O-methyltransferase
MMRIAQEFSRFADTYDKHNIIQAEVAKKLISTIADRSYSHILDIGCGRGEVYRNLLDQNITFESFTAVDISTEMLDLHPKGRGIRLIEGDFNSSLLFEKFYPPYDLLISSSALQWSRDLDLTLSSISKLSKEFYLSIFTSGTFHTLHKIADISSPIYSIDIVKSNIDQYFDANYETIRYKLHFDNTYKMLRYIKESGTSGGERRLSYREIKDLLDNYPLDYLEFEVLFITPKF